MFNRRFFSTSIHASEADADETLTYFPKRYKYLLDRRITVGSRNRGERGELAVGGRLTLLTFWLFFNKSQNRASRRSAKPGHAKCILL